MGDGVTIESVIKDTRLAKCQAKYALLSTQMFYFREMNQKCYSIY